jgi:hypothetical protein
MAAPQTQPPSFVAGNRTVAVYATVTNAEGRLVPDWSRDDFAIDDNGKRQALTLFANDIQPITLIMLRDRSGSMKPNFELEELAAGRRVVLVFTDGVDMPMNFSTHNKSLKDVIERAEEENVMVYAVGLRGQNRMPGAGERADRRRGINPGAHRSP